MFKKIIKIILIASLLIVISSFFTLLLVPTPYINHPGTITFYNETNDYSNTQINNTSSKYVYINEISTPLKKTLISIEDQEFYSHTGLDYKRIIKSLYDNLKNGKIVEGASTLSQQLVRIALLNNNQTLSRKIKEAINAKKIEAKYSKDEILEMYFNLVFFGHDLYGIYAASKYYFNKLPLEIDYAEASVLVGIINSPNKYAPDIDLSLCLKKQKQILSLLKERKIIDENQYNEALNKELNFTYSPLDNNLNNNYYRDAIIKELKENKLYESTKKEGIKITSYFDFDVQEKVNNVIQKYQNELNNNEEVAIVVMRPYTNKVIALSGGISYENSSFNRAIESKRQIGSTIKPLIYYLALNKGFKYSSEFVSEETTFKIDNIGEYSPKNSKGKYANRKINLIEAISVSDNIYAMKTALFIGLESIYNHLKNYNIEINNYSPTIALGTLELTPLELCSIYNSFASEGIFYEPSFIKEVHSYQNITLYKDTIKGKRIMQKNKTIEMNYLLKSPFDEAFVSYATPSLLYYPTQATFSAKTGTTDSSTWVCAFNKKYTICIYLGTDNNTSLSHTKIAKSIFQDLANSLCPIDIEFYDVPTNYEHFSLTNTTTHIQSFNYIKEKKLYSI